MVAEVYYHALFTSALNRDGHTASRSCLFISVKEFLVPVSQEAGCIIGHPEHSGEEVNSRINLSSGL
jgi:hypothetical protein